MSEKLKRLNFLKSPWLSLVLSLLSIFMLIRYIRIFTTAENPASYLIALMFWSLLTIVGIATLICQVVPNNKNHVPNSK